jgi:uncharacterized protein
VIYNAEATRSIDRDRRALTKLFLLLLVAVGVYLVIRGMSWPSGARDSQSGRPRVEQMVPCAHCGVNLPLSEALESRGRFYCSEEHRRLKSG